MRTYLPRSWISDKLVGGESKIHGEGVFAAAPIARGEKLMEFGGLLINGADVATELYRARSVWSVGDDAYVGLLESDPEPSLDENLNHSCDPNAWLDDEVTLTARRDIAAGEEITLDQGTWNFDEDDYLWDCEACGCGAALCRGRLTENDWQLAAIQERYRGHFHPMVQRMIDARLASRSGPR
jgi:SET domain-containing protein